MVNPKVLKEVVRSYSYVLTWMSISISVILFNKWLLAFSGFPYPIALTSWHMLFCSTIGFLCVRVFRVVKSHNMTTEAYVRRVLPIGLLYAASLWLSNASYLYLSVSFIQMTKSLMPGLVYASGVLLGTEKFSRGVTANMMLIAFGVVVCAMGELNLVMKGLITQLSALCFEAARLTLVQILINSQGLNMNPLQSLYYISPACLGCLLVPFALVELGPLRADNSLVFYPSVFLANAMAAFVLNLAVFLLIGKTSALTMNIAGVIKDWMLIFFSFSLFHAPVTALNLAGYAFCCSGVAIYNYHKLQLIRAKAALSTSKDTEKGGPGGASPGQIASAASLSHSDSGGVGANGRKDGYDSSYRSKDDILSQIRELQAEMAKVEGRGSDQPINKSN
mmetsp:Transcript_3759/g.10853  ORF Transcript_3759/g.10853 Transcript_3759/m.10853 type:complete len:392 (-) Transcript_3759:558-1733(-)